MNLKNHKTQGGDCAAFTIPSGFDRSVSIRKICNVVINLLVYCAYTRTLPNNQYNSIQHHLITWPRTFTLMLSFGSFERLQWKRFILFWNFMTVWCIVSDDKRTKVNTSALLSFVCCAQGAVDSFRNSAVHTDRIKCRQKMLCRIWKYRFHSLNNGCLLYNEPSEKKALLHNSSINT